MKNRPKKTQNAFTLIELLVVISIISLLLAISMSAMSKVRQLDKQTLCLTNLRQMAIAANVYTVNNDDYFPLARLTVIDAAGSFSENAWDFTKTFNAAVVESIIPGLLWQGETILQIHQCPSFKGSANSPGDPYTGYNYNASYIGGMITRAPGFTDGLNSIKAATVASPANCAIFGDGQYEDGANKYMRSPFTGPLDSDQALLRPYSTQGFRHAAKTNVAWCDGSATTLKKRYTETYDSLKPLIADQTGFLSEDNSAYDLK